MRLLHLFCLLLILCCSVPPLAAADTYQVVTSWGTQGTADGQFDIPMGIGVNAAGVVYVADTYNNRVQVFNATGGHIATWGEYGSGLGQFIHPYFIALDTAGSVYVADSANHRVQKIALFRVVPGTTDVPRDLDDNGLYDDVNGNGRKDFADVVLYFNQMTWIAANEPIAAFDYNGNGRIDFADVVWLFNNL